MEVVRLELHHLYSREMAATLQCDQQLLDLVEFHIITRKARNMMRKRIALIPDVRHTVLPGHLPDVGGSCVFSSQGHSISYVQYSISPAENPLILAKFRLFS